MAGAVRFDRILDRRSEHSAKRFNQLSSGEPDGPA